MKKTTAITIMAVALLSGSGWAQSQVTFEEAKAASAREGKPILLEFFRPG